MEENAYVVVRLLIRRPECFGPALRGEGGDGLMGTLVAVIEVEVEAVGGGGQGGVGVCVARTIVQSGRCKCADLQV